MIKNYILNSFFLLFLCGFFFTTAAQDVQLQWVKTIRGTHEEVGNSFTVDTAGNVFTIGCLKDTADFDAATKLSSVDGADVYVSKHDKDGVFIWAKRYGGAKNDVGNSIVSDLEGNIYITGAFVDYMNFGGSKLLKSNGKEDFFIAKIDNDGTTLWAKSMGNQSEQTATAIALDPKGKNIYVVGILKTGQVNMNPGGSPEILNGDGMFILKLKNTGEFVWAKRVGFGQGSLNLAESLSAIAVSMDNHLHIVGQFLGTVDFDPAQNNQTLTAQTTNGNNLEDGFILKLDSTGNFVWVRALTGTGRIYATSVATDASGNVIYTGSFEGTADFNPDGGSALLATPASYSFASYVCKLTGNGNYVWAKQIGQSWCRGMGVAVDPNGNIYSTGGFLGKVDFNPSPAEADTVFLESIDKSNSNAYTMKLDLNGDFLWTKKVAGGIFGSVGSNQGFKVAVDKYGSVYTLGSFQGHVDFDPSGNNNDVNYSGHNSDIFIHKMSCSSAGNTITRAKCKSYDWNGSTYTESGIYTFSDSDPVFGCPTISTLNLTIYPIEKPVINVNVFTLGTTQTYYRYQWYVNDTAIGGATNPTHTVTQNGNYFVKVETDKGCKDTSDIYMVTNVGVKTD